MFRNNKNKIRHQMKRKKLSSTDKLVVLNEEELIEQVSIRPVIYNRSLKGYRKTSLREQCWNEISEAMDAPVEECRKRWRSLRDSFAKHYKFAQRTEGGESNKHRKWVFYDKMQFLTPYLDCVSYELDRIIDELGDASEDAQSLNCEPVEIDAATEALGQSVNSTTNTKEVVEEYGQHHNNHNANVQHSSVSVQATDFVSITMENPQPATMRNNNSSIDSNLTNGNANDRHQQNTCNIHNATSSNMQCAEKSTDRSGVVLDSDEKFLLSCAPTMRRLTFRQNALARLKIQQILFDIEFQQENN